MQNGTQKQKSPVKQNRQTHQEKVTQPAVLLGRLPRNPQEGHTCNSFYLITII